jgi:tripeptide aminopeptidase
MRKAVEDTVKEMNAPEAEFTIDYIFPSVKQADDSEIVMLVKKASEKIGLGSEFKAFAAGGLSDANVLSKLMPATVLTCGYEKIHSTSECIAIEELERLANMTLAITELV